MSGESGLIIKRLITWRKLSLSCQAFTLIMIDTNNCNNYMIFDLIFLGHEEVSNFPPNCISLNQVLSIVVPRKLLN